MLSSKLFFIHDFSRSLITSLSSFAKKLNILTSEIFLQQPILIDKNIILNCNGSSQIIILNKIL